MAIESVLLIGNDNYLEIDKLQDKAEAATVYVNDATVTSIVYDAVGAQVTGQTWPLTLTYVAASNGKYRGILEDAMVLVEGDFYRASITVAGNSLTMLREFWVKAIKRR